MKTKAFLYVLLISVISIQSFAAADGCVADSEVIPQVNFRVNGKEFFAKNGELKWSDSLSSDGMPDGQNKLSLIELGDKNTEILVNCFSGNCSVPLQLDLTSTGDKKMREGTKLLAYKGHSNFIVVIGEANAKTALFVDASMREPYPIPVRAIASALDSSIGSIIFASCEFVIGECGLYRLDISKSVNKIVELPRGVQDIKVHGDFVHILIAERSQNLDPKSLLFGWTGHVEGLFDWRLMSFNLTGKCNKSRSIIKGISGFGYFPNRWNISPE